MNDKDKQSSWIGTFISNRAKVYAKIKDDEAKEILERNGILWDSRNVHRTLDDMEQKGFVLVDEQVNVTESLLTTTKQYELKLYKLVDSTKYNIGFRKDSLKDGDGQEETSA